MKNIILIITLAVAVVLVSGCTQQSVSSDDTIVIDDAMIKSNDTMIKPGSMAKEDNKMMGNGSMMEEPKYSGSVLAGTSAKLLDFNRDDYDAALESDKIILLYFYADWCPVCKAELPEMYSAFNELKTDKIIGFRVNFKDGSTDNDEKSLAQEFQVPYQHYKIILKNDSAVLKAPDTWNKDRYISEINSALATYGVSNE